MKIQEKYVNFSEQINIGRLSFFIFLDKYGVDISIQDLIKEAANFSHIVVQSLTDDIMNQKEELLQFIKGVIKLNEYVHIDLFTHGLENFRGFIPINNMTINVQVHLNYSKIERDKRINAKSIAWYAQMNCNFIFDIRNENDFDEACMIIHDHGIKKQYVFFNPIDSFDRIKLLCRTNGYNLGMRIDV